MSPKFRSLYFNIFMSFIITNDSCGNLGVQLEFVTDEKCTELNTDDRMWVILCSKHEKRLDLPRRKQRGNRPGSDEIEISPYGDSATGSFLPFLF